MSETVHFVPGAGYERAYRDALGQFATGVTVVTAMTSDGPIGMTANSFASVSLDPPLVLWSPAKSSRRYGAFGAAQRYAIHVLCADQRDMAQSFAASGRDGFARFPWQEGESGAPLLDNCLARFECRAEARHDAGDHVIIIGRVERALLREGPPLLYVRGVYGGLSLDAQSGLG